VTRFHIEKLTKRHSLGEFDCGAEALNTYLQRFALQSQSAQAAQSYVCLADDEHVVGYFTLVVGQIEFDDAPERLRKGLARHPVPVTVIARLAVDQKWQGQGLGMGLLKDSLLRSLNVADVAGMRAVVVQAKDDEAKTFYQRFGFVDGFANTMHLYLLTKELRHVLAS
jgi:predicted N-acetyltransferase YhbS